MEHSHSFWEEGGNTVMIDKFSYEVPFGFLGDLFDKFILKHYMTKLLAERNNIIRNAAESEQWKNFIY